MSESTVQEAMAPYGLIAAPLAVAGEKRVLLHGVSWSTYKALLKDLGNSRSSRLTFDSGELEIMSPLDIHEDAQFGIGQLVTILVDEFGLECRALGSLTCERQDLDKAIEPDGCFYIQHFKDVKGVKTIELGVHPPPDLMIEIDITTDSLNKLPICAALGVLEHWRYNAKSLEIRILKNGSYFESAESLAFPGMLFAKRMPEFLHMHVDGLMSMQRSFRAWIRDELRKRKTSKGLRRPKRV